MAIDKQNMKLALIITNQPYQAPAPIPDATDLTTADNWALIWQVHARFMPLKVPYRPRAISPSWQEIVNLAILDADGNAILDASSANILGHDTIRRNVPPYRPRVKTSVTPYRPRRNCEGVT